MTGTVESEHGQTDVQRGGTIREERTVFREQIIGPADDELGDQFAKLLQFLFAFSLVLVCGICVATTNNDVLEVLPEVVLRAQEIRVGKIEEGEVL